VTNVKSCLGCAAIFLLAIGGCGGAQTPAAGAESNGDDTREGAAGEGSSGASGSAEAVKIEAPAEGASAHESRNVEMQFDLTLLKEGEPAGMQSGSWSIYEERTTKVLATKERAIEKLELVFGRREAKALLGVEKPSVTAGKSYVLDASTGAVAVKSPSGKEAPAAESSAVSAEYGWVGRPSPLLEMLQGVKPGASTEPPAEARRVLIGELPGIDHEQTKLEVKLLGVQAKTAKLQLTVASEIDNGDMKFTLSLEGPAEVDTATGWVKSLDLSGKLKAEGSVKHNKKPMQARGKGSAKISRKAELR
jgi:hypothetical protein